MLGKTWRISLLVVALIGMIWPDLIGAATWWVSLVAVTVLLIGEIVCEDKYCDHVMGASGKASRSRGSFRRKRR